MLVGNIDITRGCTLHIVDVYVYIYIYFCQHLTQDPCLRILHTVWHANYNDVTEKNPAACLIIQSGTWIFKGCLFKANFQKKHPTRWKKHLLPSQCWNVFFLHTLSGKNPSHQDLEACDMWWTIDYLDVPSLPKNCFGIFPGKDDTQKKMVALSRPNIHRFFYCLTYPQRWQGILWNQVSSRVVVGNFWNWSGNTHSPPWSLWFHWLVFGGRRQINKWIDKNKLIQTCQIRWERPRPILTQSIRLSNC